ncbi:CDP-glycerol glycerophosphotransferase family protein [Virgibacillus litoralis]|uniref:CDP-glycerol glycerophosphotransferase n=1 Tax=Virgibacillus litoralis TaxID=578221 RepID=A0ABS4HE93_9BACI|nr:CDP-glycerol glycerophosphotransferase family protein [Virgibacillus litoralis]MBP1949054.1 CDP-glycerol glycerophosphotransferase [Virgibacillus litoralis]
MKNWIALIIIYLCNCLPIKQNKVFLFSYYGSQYGCSPKYITDYIKKYYPGDRFDVVWAFNDPDSKKHLSHVKKVKIMSLRYFYELCTSKVVITNYRTTGLFVKRKKQYYIQTWHSSLRLKHIEKDAEAVLPPSYVKMAKKDSAKCDLLLSGCKYSTAIFKRSFWYGGEIFEHGTPRNDLLFKRNPDKRADVLEKLNLVSGSKVLLYAPTFRKNNNLEVYNIDWSLLVRQLESRFGNEWTILVKLHPHLTAESGKLTYGDHVKDVTSYDDIQELLLAADVLISDYSSLIFDYSITKRPCFLYVPDLEEYTRQDRKLYFDITDLPFISATSNNDLLEKVATFDYVPYRKEIEKFLYKIGTFEDGNASKQLVKRIDCICHGQKGKRSEEIYEAV